MSDLVVLLGDQLFQDISALPEAPIFMREDMGLCTSPRHHQQKLVLFLSAMRHRRQELRDDGRRVHYTELDPHDDRPFVHALLDFCSEKGITRIATFEPADPTFAIQLRKELDSAGIDLDLAASPMFLTSAEDWEKYVEKHQRRKMAEFYEFNRKRLNILMDGERPVGNRWSFDTENRRAIPEGKKIPHVWRPKPDAMTREVMDLVSVVFKDHAGSAYDFEYPVDHSQSREWLEDFLDWRFPEFGPYEDAIQKNEPVLWHSVLTPALNTGLLTPAEVVRAALDRDVPLESLEGFIRQIIGWREFIRGISREYSSMDLPKGPFHHRRLLKESWWTGDTGLPALDDAIRRVLRYGYCHHIERLMVIGAVMLMCEVDPGEAYRYFMEMFIDSAEWVMGPNVLGMSQFADGGCFATKPYFSGASYILRMSDHDKGDWCDVWDGLYWRFIEKNRDFFSQNPRMAAIASGADRLDPKRRDRIFNAAEKFIDKVTAPPQA
ncbi:MAG: cryptochrome/photolyase family protein [Armatimonadetes bacterium]|nr:cryptochrome/photolyase family protein [Armatimonadota bacterium]